MNIIAYFSLVLLLTLSLLVWWKFRRLNSAWLESQSNLQTAISTRDEFLSIASHELRTPLTSMKLHTQLFQRELRRNNSKALSPEMIEKFVSQVDRQISRLDRLVSEMLDIGRINTGRFEMKFEDFLDLKTLMLEVLERHQAALKLAECTVNVDLCDQVLVKGDRYRLEQVVLNLLSNTIRYAPVSTTVIILSKKNRSALLSIEDNGPGIELETQSKLFNRFEKASAQKEVGGLGLGLYIARQIIDHHQGTIKVESEPGKGTRFDIELPLQD